MTTSRKDQDKAPPASKKSGNPSAEINKSKAELSDDELKKVTGGATSRKTFTNIDP